jgi:hypothetical protein
MYEHGVSGRPVQDRRALDRRKAPGRRASGPRPVRPTVSTVAVRPAEAERPHVPRARRVPLPLPATRLLARRPLAGSRAGVRRALAGVAVTVVAGAVVVGLGLLADTAAAGRAAEEAAAPAPRGPIVLTVDLERTPWDVARRVAPGASGPELAALAEQIVIDNSLGPVPLRPGQVLRVTSG